MVRDEEISRLKKYAQALGLVVRIIHNPNEDSAAISLDGTELTINEYHNKTKIETILSLIHELGHMLHFIHEKNRAHDIKFEEAIDRQNLHEMNLSKTPPPKHLREKILQVEKLSADWWDIIYKETKCQFAYWRLELARKFDIWQYEVYYETGSFPSKKERKQKYKEFKKKLRKASNNE